MSKLEDQTFFLKTFRKNYGDRRVTPVKCFCLKKALDGDKFTRRVPIDKKALYG